MKKKKLVALNQENLISLTYPLARYYKENSPLSIYMPSK